MEIEISQISNLNLKKTFSAKNSTFHQSKNQGNQQVKAIET